MNWLRRAIPTNKHRLHYVCHITYKEFAAREARTFGYEYVHGTKYGRLQNILSDSSARKEKELHFILSLSGNSESGGRVLESLKFHL